VKLDAVPTFALSSDLRTWTQKEALIKALGTGLSLPLKDLSVSIDPRQPGRVLSIENASQESRAWKMTISAFDGSGRVAVCVRSETDQAVSWFKQDLEDFATHMAFF
jgi:phosphopantetheinyl transferase